MTSRPLETRLDTGELDTGEMEAQVARIVEYFYDMYKIRGRVAIEFTRPRTLPDSDMNSVVNTYLYPEDPAARESFGDQARLHMQFLGDEINPGVFGYRYEATICPDTPGADKARLKVTLENLTPRPFDVDPSPA